VVDARWRVRRADGSEVAVAGGASPIVGPDGRPAGAVLTVRDDGARAAADAAARERDALAGQLREVFAQSPVSTILYDPAGRATAVNAAFERLWGIRLDDLPADYSVLADPQLAAAGVLPLLRRAFGLDGAACAEGAGEAVALPPLRYDVATTTGRGETTWTRAHAYPVRDAAGAVARVVLTHEDVTAQYEAAAALQARTAEAEAARAQMAGVLEAMADRYFALDADFRVAGVNRAMERATGVARADLLGRDFWAIFPGTVGTEFERQYRRVAAEGRRRTSSRSTTTAGSIWWRRWTPTPRRAAA
jgi:PAS domain S-box-containing protein